MKIVTFQDIKNNPEIKTYIAKADEVLSHLGFTEHSFAHVTRCAVYARDILMSLGYDERTCELGEIAGYMHDIGNLINRIDHAQSGAIMAFRILDHMEMPPEEIATVVTAIGNHDEGTAVPVNAVAAALILADKTDVRRSRVRNRDMLTFDIHDRVNYAVEDSSFTIDAKRRTVSLNISIDTSICAVMDYFEIFLGRMLLCKKAAEFLEVVFELTINGVRLL
ncbi:HD domain-containing protein [Zongyangia hominis]|uniref:HD domain-containing protein n=1 Tax=Zongyangia hominis TaxID=2763677 RepID=A0A926EFM9_9FIRM|nr:HD domain-containing protein [Zongyangia hominis]MBC8570971.1 HD domain-containing protein [Zongyangia hominis]